MRVAAIPIVAGLLAAIPSSFLSNYLTYKALDQLIIALFTSVTYLLIYGSFIAAMLYLMPVQRADAMSIFSKILRKNRGKLA